MSMTDTESRLLQDATRLLRHTMGTNGVWDAHATDERAQWTRLFVDVSLAIEFGSAEATASYLERLSRRVRSGGENSELLFRLGREVRDAGWRIRNRSCDECVLYLLSVSDYGQRFPEFTRQYAREIEDTIRLLARDHCPADGILDEDAWDPAGVPFASSFLTGNALLYLALNRLREFEQASQVGDEFLAQIVGSSPAPVVWDLPGVELLDPPVSALSGIVGPGYYGSLIARILDTRRQETRPYVRGFNGLALLRMNERPEAENELARMTSDGIGETDRVWNAGMYIRLHRALRA